MQRSAAPRAIVALILAAGFAWAASAQSTPPQSASAPSTPAAAPPVGQEAELPASRPTDPALEECLHYIDRRDYSAASQAVHSYLAAHPGSAEGHFLLGFVFYRQDKPRDSLAEYTLGARFRNPEANDLAVVAMDYILLRDYGDADKWLTRAVSWSPRNELYWYYLGRTKYVENQFQAAIDAFQKCLAITPHDIRAEYNTGLAWAGLGRDDNAAADYRTAIAWEEAAGGRDPQPYLDLGTLLLDQGKPGLAQPFLAKAVALDDKNPTVREKLGQAWEQLHDLPKADEQMHAAVTLAPGIASLHFEMGRIYQKEGLSAQAKAEFARCAALNATHSTDAAQTPNPAPHP